MIRGYRIQVHLASLAPPAEFSPLCRSLSAPNGLQASPNIQPPWDADDVHYEDLELDLEIIKTFV